MNFLKSKFLITKLVVLIITCIIISPLIMTEGAAVTINSYQGETPTIDGEIDEQEEQGTGKPLKFSLPHDPWDLAGRPREIEIKFGTSHSNDSYLYINTVVNFKEIGFSKMFYFMRKNGTNDNFDMKCVSSFTDDSFDGFRNSSASMWNVNFDTDFGGTEDAVMKCIRADKYTTFELRMPFNSGDQEGNDLNIQVGDILDVELILHIQHQVDHSDWYGNFIHESIEIIIKNTTAIVPQPKMGIVLGFMLIIGIIVRRKKKEKKKL